MNKVVRALADAVGSGAVLAGESVNADYGTDEALKAIPVPPAAVVLPRATRDVAAALRVAREFGVPVRARGAGTGLSGACIPVPGGIVISFERMSALLELDHEGHVAVVQPGLTLAELSSGKPP